MKREQLTVEVSVFLRYRPWWFRFTPSGRKARQQVVTITRDWNQTQQDAA